jgi:hypothetical protein
MGELIKAKTWAWKQRVKELTRFLDLFPNSEYAGQRRLEKIDLEEKIKQNE